MAVGFGGAVKLTGESEYRKALSSINMTLKQTSADIKLVTVQYKDNDKNLFALTQRQEALNKQLEAQDQKVKTLDKEYKDLSAQYKANKEAHDGLVKSLDEETEKLKKIESENGKTSKEYREQASLVASLSKEVATSTKNLDQNETSVAKVKLALTQASTEMRKTEQDLASMDKEIDEAKDDSGDLSEEVKKAGDEAKKAGEGGFTVFKGVLADLASSAIKSALSGIADLGKAVVGLGKDAISGYADYEQLVGGIETLFGAGGKTFQEFERATGLTGEEARNEYAKLMDAQNIVMSNASEAYKNVGMSANEYMETVTAFSASLVSSLGGDTVAAAEAADLALQDISDNANKMGTDIDSVQAAFSGFAKGQYQLLDNLKLGYGGSKTEMERLLADAEKFSGVKYDINNLNDVYSAIHVIQTEMGITGTTAKEAAKTISGSTAMMKASWSNLVTGLADENANLGDLIDDFIESILTVADNILPHIGTIVNGIAKLATTLIEKLLPELLKKLPGLISSTLPSLLSATQTVLKSVLAVLPQILPVLSSLLKDSVKLIISMLPDFVSSGIDILLALIDGISSAIPDLLEMLPTIIEDTVNTLLSKLPEIINTGIALLNGIVKGILLALPQLIKMLPTIINDTAATLIDNLPTIINCGIDLIFALIDGLIEALPDLVEMVPTIIYKITQTLMEKMDDIKDQGKKIIEKLLTGIEEKIGNLLLKIKEVNEKVIGKIKELPDKIKKYGKKIVEGLVQGIQDAAEWCGRKIKDFCEGVAGKFKSFFGIFSPSHLMRDEVGKYLALGIGEGFTDEMSQVSKEMAESIPTDFDTTTHLNNMIDSGDFSGSGTFYSYNDLVKAFKEALEGVEVEMDDKQMGKFVKKTVTEAIYYT